MSTKGIIQEVTFNFLDHDICPSVHYLGNNKFRVKFYVMSDDDSEMKNDGIRLDVLCSPLYFDQTFNFHTDYSQFNTLLNVNFTAQAS